MAATSLSALVLGCVGLAVVPTAPSAAAEQGATAFTIRSSLDGKTVLPHRIRWIAYPSAPVLFPGVEFLIDGKLVFAEPAEPFAFGADGRDEATRTVKTGYLVTSWLAPGKHSFTVRGKALVAGARTTATKTVVARCRARQLRPRNSRERGSASSRPRCRPTGTCCTGRHRSAWLVPDHSRPALHPPERPGAPQAHQDRLRRRTGDDHHRRPRLDGRSERGRVCDPWGPRRPIRGR